MGELPPGAPPPPPPGPPSDFSMDMEYDGQMYGQPGQEVQDPARKVMGTEGAKSRLKAYAAMKTGTLGAMLPTKKNKNKELKKFLDEESDKPAISIKLGSQGKESVMDKMAEITK